MRSSRMARWSVQDRSLRYCFVLGIETTIMILSRLSQAKTFAEDGFGHINIIQALLCSEGW